MNHTCETAESGSERSENTCVACAEELKAAQVRGKYVPPDYLAEWLRYTTPKGSTPGR